MAKRNDYITGREDGLLMALEIVKNEGVEALEKEIEFRNKIGRASCRERVLRLV